MSDFAGTGQGNDNVSHGMNWKYYHPLENIYGWVDFLETTYEFCESELIGQTYEGRDMRVMKVDNSNTKLDCWTESIITD